MGLINWLNPDKNTTDYTVFVVSDDPFTSQQIQNILEEQGYVVMVTASSQDVLELLKSMDLPHVFIGDFAEPDVDAKEFLEKARIRFGKATLSPVLLLMDSPDDEMTANELGVYDLLPKPVEAERLIQCVKQLIHNTVKPQDQ